MNKEDYEEQFRVWDENEDGLVEFADFVKVLLQGEYDIPPEDLERVSNMKAYELYDISNL